MFASGNQYSDDALMRADFRHTDGWSCDGTCLKVLHNQSCAGKKGLGCRIATFF